MASPPIMDPRALSLLLNKPELRELFIGLGATPELREQKLSEILQDFYARMSDDIMIGFFFDGRDVAAIADKQKEFILKAFGAKTTYSGKPPADAHQALPPILEGHFNRRLQLLHITLLAHGLSEKSAKIWVEFENAFRDGIIGT
jgi:truncated hemoglobin YjbI